MFLMSYITFSYSFWSLITPLITVMIIVSLLIFIHVSYVHVYQVMAFPFLLHSFAYLSLRYCFILHCSLVQSFSYRSSISPPSPRYNLITLSCVSWYSFNSLWMSQFFSFSAEVQQNILHETAVHCIVSAVMTDIHVCMTLVRCPSTQQDFVPIVPVVQQHFLSPKLSLMLIGSFKAWSGFAFYKKQQGKFNPKSSFLYSFRLKPVWKQDPDRVWQHIQSATELRDHWTVWKHHHKYRWKFVWRISNWKPLWTAINWAEYVGYSDKKANYCKL